MAPRKDGAVVGGIPLPAPRQNNALRRRERRCRCKNQRGWAREFLTVFDLEKRDLPCKGYNASARLERIQAQYQAPMELAHDTPSNRRGIRGWDNRSFTELNAKAESAA